MKNIITIQHTQSIHHINGMVGSWTDWDLSELGIQQAVAHRAGLIPYWISTYKNILDGSFAYNELVKSIIENL